ncbi:MAG: glycosyltransferase family 2 protein [Ignavibacteria bacterium]
MVKTSIIILNYNTAAYAEELVGSLARNIPLDEYEVILADNNSPEKSFREIGKKYPFVKILEFESNEGFATGNNKASEFAEGEYLLFINPDVLINENNLHLLHEYLEANPDTGIVSGLMVDTDNKPIYCFNSFPDIEWEIYQFAGTGYDAKIRKLLSRDEIKSNSNFETDWFHGAFIFISKYNFKALKGFNEKYFMYYEDIELCYSVKNKLGLKNVCIPEVKYIHHTRATFSDVKKDDIYYFHINRGKMIFISNYGLFLRSILELISISSIILRILVLPFWNKYRNLKKQKFVQLLKVIRLHASSKYLSSSKFEYIKR